MQGASRSVKTALAGTFVVGALLLANVVGAGVFLVLVPIARAVPDELAQLGALLLVGLVAVACSVLFLFGCAQVARRRPLKP